MNKAYATAVIAALALSACQQPKETPVAEKTQPAPEAKPGIAVAQGRLILPAVTGNPGAAYLQIDNRAGANVVVSAISIDGAEKAEMHQTIGDAMTAVERVEIAPGTSITFEPGQLHVMAFNLASRLKAGGTTEATITFADGDKVTTPLKIEAMGAGTAEHGESH